MIFSFFGILFSSLYIYSQERIYSGSFTFVFEQKTSKKSSIPGNLSELSFLQELYSPKSNKIKTEKEILTSPYVLRPVYEDIKNLKNQLDSDDLSWDFDDFASNIKIEILKKTDVVKVTYKDTNREIILPILNRMVDRFEEYSVKEQVDSLNNTIEYLEKQVNSLRIQSREDTLKTERFGLDNGIINEIEGLKLYDFRKIDVDQFKQIESLENISNTENNINRYSYLFALLQKLEADKLESSIF